jgi:hypothetical protein
MDVSRTGVAESKYESGDRCNKGSRRDPRKMGHVVKLCYADVLKPLILRCFNTGLSVSFLVTTLPKKVIYGQV